MPYAAKKSRNAKCHHPFHSSYFGEWYWVIMHRSLIGWRPDGASFRKYLHTGVTATQAFSRISALNLVVFFESVMTKKQTYTQIRAKKNWLLHSSSNRRKFKSKGRLSTQKPRRSTASVGNEHIKSSQKRTIFHRLAQFKELFNSYGKMEKSLNLTSIGFGFIDISLLPINMAFLALVNGTQYLNHYFQELCKTIGIMNESLNTGIKDGFKSILFYQRVCINLKFEKFKRWKSNLWNAFGKQRSRQSW